MRSLLLVHASGLTPEQAVRGDLAATLSDLIADGSFSSISGAPDLEAVLREAGPDRVAVVAVPFTNMARFDRDLGEIRAKASVQGAALAVLSESLLVTARSLPELRPGRAVPAADVPRLLARLLED